MNNQYSIPYFIEKFTAIPDERWCENAFHDMNDRHCALGFCGIPRFPRAAGRPPFMESGDHEINPFYAEAKALRDIIGGNVGAINNGTNANYQQPTPKARILAALHDAKAKAEAALDQYETRPLLPVTKPEPVEVA